MSYPTYEQSLRSKDSSALARTHSALELHSRRDDSSNGAHTLAKALGWFSIGLGLTQLALPRSLGRAIGVGEQPALMPVLGVREIASGIGILTQSDPTNGVRARVAGDLMDLALLGTAYAATRSREDRVAVATAAAAVLGVTALDVYCAGSLQRAPHRAREKAGFVHVTKSITINRPLEELYTFWRRLENLPRVMRHLESVREVDVQRSHWVAAGPAGTRLEWDAEITTDRPNQLIAWQSRGAEFPSQGFVEFKQLPAGRGTVVTVHLEYAPVGGRLGARIAKLFGQAPEQEIETDLRRWKQLTEAGEIATTEGQPSGKRSAISRHLP